jgi:hypothetical protein
MSFFGYAIICSSASDSLARSLINSSIVLGAGALIGTGFISAILVAGDGTANGRSDSRGAVTVAIVDVYIEYLRCTGSTESNVIIINPGFRTRVEKDKLEITPRLTSNKAAQEIIAD